MPEQQTPSNKQKFVSWLSSLKRNLPPALVAAESNQIFYPATTIVTRLINSPERVSNWEQFNKAVFFDLNKNKGAMPSFTEVMASLNKGALTSALNSGATRTFRFMTQDNIQRSMLKTISPIANNHLDEKTQQTLVGGISGAVTGMSERLLFHPLDTRKILKQMNVETVTGLYNGLGVGVLRDGVSAGFFFGSFNAAYQFLKSHGNPWLTNANKDTFDKLGAATVAGGVTAIGTNPLNVVKTRMQSSGGNNNSSASILSTLQKNYQKEGLKSLVSGNLLKGMSEATKATQSKGFIQTAMDIYAKEGMSAFAKGLSGNIALAPMRSTIPYFAFLFAKKKWDEYQGSAKELQVAQTPSPTPTRS